MPAEGPRERLQQRLAALTRREEKISQHLQGQDGRLEADFGDIANFVAADEVLEGLEDAALKEIQEIRAALERLESGAYGVCVSCGSPIAPRRLAILPHTQHCITCVTLAEG
jgi:DnaK suppressor protein